MWRVPSQRHVPETYVFVVLSKPIAGVAALHGMLHLSNSLGTVETRPTPICSVPSQIGQNSDHARQGLAGFSMVALGFRSLRGGCPSNRRCSGREDGYIAMITHASRQQIISTGPTDCSDSVSQVSVVGVQVRKRPRRRRRGVIDITNGANDDNNSACNHIKSTTHTGTTTTNSNNNVNIYNIVNHISHG